MHDGEHHVEALAAAAAVQPHKGGVGRIGSHHDALAALQNFREHFLRARADQPMAFLGDADGHGFVFIGIQATNDGGGGGERNFVLAGAAAEEDSYAQSFFLVHRGSS